MNNYVSKRSGTLALPGDRTEYRRERWGVSVAGYAPNPWNPFCCPVGPTAQYAL